MQKRIKSKFHPLENISALTFYIHLKGYDEIFVIKKGLSHVRGLVQALVR